MEKLMEVRFWADDGELQGARLRAPDYEHWAKVDIWTKAEAILILNRIDPSHVERKGATPEHFIEYFQDPEDLKISMDKILKELNGTDFQQVRNLSGHDGIKRVDFIKWAQSKGYKIPDELLRTEAFPIMTDKSPPYLDPNNSFFSEELKAAIDTWLAMYGPEGKISCNEKLQNQAHRQTIDPYVKKHYPQFKKKSERERIAIMVNARKSGASRTK